MKKSFRRKSKSKVTEASRIQQIMNVMRETLLNYRKYPHIQENLHEFAVAALPEVQRRFTKTQVEHLSQQLLPWLQWHTGKYRKLAPFQDSEICKQSMQKVLKMGFAHCLCLVILTAEFRTKPGNS